MSSHILDNNIIPFNMKKYDSYKSIIELIGDAKIVMLGESSHGTYEFYYIRQMLTQYLIQEKDFNAIAIEGDFTSCYNVNLYLQGDGHADKPLYALRDFKRFPTWMWRNEVIVNMLKELRNYNDINSNKVHLFGLDLYSLHNAIKAVIEYLKVHDPDAASDAVKRYSCFENTTQNPQEYGALVKYGYKKACIEEVARQVITFQEIAFKNHSNLEEGDELFYATQNAILVKNAELYYRGMFDSRQNTWNIRDQHMFDTLQSIISHLSSTLNKDAKVIIWAHNSHVGNALATEMSRRRELNIGQLVKEYYKDKSFFLGFSTYTGSVLTANNWDEMPEIKCLNPGLEGSYEELFHNTNCKNFLLAIKQNEELREFLSKSRLQRAVGVIYRPDTERYSHYYMANLAYQFDAMLHLDSTHAIKPI